MIIEIDNREPIIIKEYFSKCTNSTNSTNNLITSKLKSLDQGDFIIRDKDENILLIIERKTINDLLSSVKDSRYIDQSERYSQLDISSSKIIYIIEGNFKNFHKDSIEFKTIYSCIFSLNYNKGFTVLFTESVNSTCTIIEEYLNRLIENKISSKIKLNLVKKQTITKENIDSYMLNLVPSIGLQTAKEILSNTNKSFYEFWTQIKNSEIDLESIKIKNRKLSKKIIENIKNYL
jgi:ERCC4-type nuclease